MTKLCAADSSRINELMARYGAALDDRRYQDWLALFDEQATYLLQPRENYDRNLPLATMRMESKGMLADRVYGIENTLFHQPYYQRHVIGMCIGVSPPDALPGQVEPPDSQTGLGAQASYAVYRTKTDGMSEVFNVGRYLMQLVEHNDQLLIRRMHVIFDSEIVANSVIYPI